MKNKLLGLAACLLALVLAVAAPLALPEHRTKPRVHQHRGALPEAPCTNPEDGGLCTYLPIVEIDTGGVTIPGRPIHSEEETTSYVLAEDGQTTIAAQMKVIGTDTGEYHHANGTPDVESSVRIRVRGNSSRRFDKPSYAIRLVDAEGGNAPQSLMGMDAHHEWVLYGPWLDKTAVRNYLFYNLAGELMDYAPNVRYCEVIVDGEYQGLYLLAETITAGKNGARLPLEVSARGRTYSGYLLRLDHNRPETRSLRSFTEYTYIQDEALSLQLEFPGEKNRSEELEQQIRQDFSDFEKALYSYDYDREKYGYASRIDVDSFVDYFILNELAGNVDAGNFSTYLYKGSDGLFRMCVWDFNNACDNYFEAELGHEGFFMPWRLWYWMMMKDEDFTQPYHHPLPAAAAGPAQRGGAGSVYRGNGGVSGPGAGAQRCPLGRCGASGIGAAPACRTQPDQPRRGGRAAERLSPQPGRMDGRQHRDTAPVFRALPCEKIQ